MSRNPDHHPPRQGILKDDDGFPEGEMLLSKCQIIEPYEQIATLRNCCHSDNNISHQDAASLFAIHVREKSEVFAFRCLSSPISISGKKFKTTKLSFEYLLTAVQLSWVHVCSFPQGWQLNENPDVCRPSGPNQCRWPVPTRNGSI